MILWIKLVKEKKIEDFTVDDGDKIFGVIHGLLVDKSNKKIVSWKISDIWLNCKVNFVNSEKEDEDIGEYVENYLDELIKKILF